MSSDTPRTDAERFYLHPNGPRHYVVHSDFARQLERELTNVNAVLEDWNRVHPQQIAALQDKLAAQTARADALAAERDALREEHKQLHRVLELAQEANGWRDMEALDLQEENTKLREDNERLRAMHDAIHESICSCNIVDKPEWYYVCEWHEGVTGEERGEHLAKLINRIGTEIGLLREENERLRHGEECHVARPGEGTYECRTDAPCLACKVRLLTKDNERMRELLAEWLRVQRRYPNTVAVPGSLLARTSAALERKA